MGVVVLQFYLCSLCIFMLSSCHGQMPLVGIDMGCYILHWSLTHLTSRVKYLSPFLLLLFLVRGNNIPGSQS